MRTFLTIFFIALTTFCYPTAGASGNGAASDWQSHATIRSAAQDFLVNFMNDHHDARVEINLGNLDPRLKLKTCDQALRGFMPPGSRTIGNTTVGVRCDSGNAWSIYVAARVDVFGPVLTTRHPIARETLIGPEDLVLVERNLADLPYGYYSSSEPVAGMKTRRTIAAGTVLTPQMVNAPKLVKRGQTVTVIAEGGGLKVRTNGKALSDGKSGDIVRVESSGSKRVVDGVVVSQGVVKVTL